MSVTLPVNVSKILDSLSATDKETMLSYLASLAGEKILEPMEEDDKDPAATEAAASSPVQVQVTSKVDHPRYDPASGKEDYEHAGECKQQAADATSSGDHETALALYNQAVLAAPPSALLYANRAMCLEQLKHYDEAVEDCTAALELNPDSAKALKVRGKLRYTQFQDWHGALSDLNQAQGIDFDPDVAQLLKELTELRKQEELEQAQQRIAKEDNDKKKAQEIKKAQAEARRQEEATAAGRNSAGGRGAGGMPGMAGGMPGGIDPTMMAGLMSDPEMQEAMKNPKVVQAFQELMSGPGGPMGLLSNPAKLQQLMTDPDVGPVLQKLMGKFMGGGAAGGMPGMPGGAGNMGGFGGAGPNTGGDADDIPDLGEIPELD